MSDTEPQVALAERLGSIQVALRSDLEVSRHLFQDNVSYIVRDPITFTSHDFSAEDYSIFAAINGDETLEKTVEKLIAEKTFDENHIEDFYQFIVSLHRLGFLNLPISDDKSLYARFERKKTAAKKAKWMSLMYFKIPLFNPDSFLNRYIHLAKHVFTKTAFFIWLCLMTVSGYLTYTHFDAMTEPLNGLLAAQNIAFMWVALIGLKIFHEFGHAFACKHFGGHVPEMGVNLIMMTPCAYMDATDSWKFTSKRKRIIVCLAGMYIESVIAAIALFVWVLTPSGMMHECAYQTMFLASLMTVAFNINPLMRFDGYYIFSDMVEVPNLRSRSTDALAEMVKRIVIGVPIPEHNDSSKNRILLYTFGFCATIYRLSITLGICYIIATKFFLVGLYLGGVYVVLQLYKYIKNSLGYLLFSPECASHRLRANLAIFGLCIVLPCLISTAPLPSQSHITGVIAPEHTTVLRSKAEGFVDSLHVLKGQHVKRGTSLVKLINTDLEKQLAHTQALVNVSKLKYLFNRQDNNEETAQELERLKAHTIKLTHEHKLLAELNTITPDAGFITECLEPTAVGTYIKRGDPVASISWGQWQVKILMTQEQMIDLKLKIGGEVSCKTNVNTQPTIKGQIIQIAKSVTHQIQYPQLTQLAGGDISVDPESGISKEPYYLVTVAINPEDASIIKSGSRAMVQFESHKQTLAGKLYRSVLKLAHELDAR